MNDSKWTSEVLFDKGCRFGKLKMKVDKNGNDYLWGDFNRGLKIKISKNTFENAEKDEWLVDLYPVKRRKEY